ncbi:hypothetical protein QJQ45_015040 [Haematococcus lacustris]|nr:hypothetical protein QJQ45_015040 [Haematococcus lacustris]
MPAALEAYENVAVPSLAHELLGAPYEEPLYPDHADWPQHVPAAAVDVKDGGTGDAIPRDPRILRLTGRHPLNCEPPMQHLMASGFITPPSIHYVRNHGAAPKIKWSEHRIHLKGLVERPCSLSMDELLQLPQVTMPITLVCAGNRRKEENMIKKSIGFNWGPCAVSTSYWTGVRLRDLLLHVGVKSPAEGELPKGEDGSYGTSVTLSKAMDLDSDIIIAYKQNGRWLTPDHGFPVRIIIPGFIGGRMVKWLCEISVDSQESQNYYHFLDNRVLPSHVDQELATKEGWWYKPDFIINDLNINSAVAQPWHDEVLMLGGPNAAAPSYTVKGYAYAGGGRKIIRVEISLDLGVTWRLAEIRRFEEPTPAGKHWCWVHWDIAVPLFDFFTSRELLLRAWDETQNTQPAAITWNVMGMMNNCHFRILIHPHTDSHGNIGVRFQHPAPVEVGELGHVGWREEDNMRKQALEAAGITAATGPLPPPAQMKVELPAEVKKVEVQVESSKAAKTFTLEDVAQHNSEESAWFVYEDKVYDATSFLEDHPGGADSIVIVAGMDATEDFNAIHSKKAKAMLADYYLGDLVASHISTKSNSSSDTDLTTTIITAAAPDAKVAVVTAAVESHALADLDESVASIVALTQPAPITLNPRAKVPLKLVERVETSYNTRLLRFALPSPEHRLGLPCGRHLFVYGHTQGETVVRAYTPISSDDDLGRLDLLIKVYGANQHPAYPLGGKMSQHLDSLKIGDEIQVKGPIGHFVYEGRGAYLQHGKHRGTAKHFSMLAGGTGITPMYQVIKAVLKDMEDTTQMSLLYANLGESDILLRTELDALAAAHPDRFKVWYILSNPPAGWAYTSGHISEALMRSKLAPGGPDSLGLMCGPPGLLDNVCVPGLTAMGYPKDRQVAF